MLTLVHDADHIRQARALPPVLYGVAVLALLSIGTTLGLLIRRHPWAQQSAAAQGLATVVGVGAVHVAPEWSSLADSYSAAHADALSWAIIMAMILAGLALTASAVSDRG